METPTSCALEPFLVNRSPPSHAEAPDMDSSGAPAGPHCLRRGSRKAGQLVGEPAAYAELHRLREVARQENHLRRQHQLLQHRFTQALVVIGDKEEQLDLLQEENANLHHLVRLLNSRIAELSASLAGPAPTMDSASDELAHIWLGPEDSAASLHRRCAQSAPRAAGAASLTSPQSPRAPHSAAAAPVPATPFKGPAGRGPPAPAPSLLSDAARPTGPTRWPLAGGSAGSLQRIRASSSSASFPAPAACGPPHTLPSAAPHPWLAAMPPGGAPRGAPGLLGDGDEGDAQTAGLPGMHIALEGELMDKFEEALGLFPQQPPGSGLERSLDSGYLLAMLSESGFDADCVGEAASQAGAAACPQQMQHSCAATRASAAAQQLPCEYTVGDLALLQDFCEQVSQP